MTDKPIKSKTDNRDAKPRVAPCDCRHPYQDQVYGKGMRFQNAYAKGWRCTVCSKEHPA